MKSMVYKNVLGLAVLVDYITTANGCVNLVGVYLFGVNRLPRLNDQERVYIERVIMTEHQQQCLSMVQS